MTPTKLKPSDTLVLEKDAKGYVHIKLYKDGKGIDVTELTLSPERAGLPVINHIIVFLKEKYAEDLKAQGIIHNYFQSNEGIWCALLNVDVYFELDNSPTKTFTKQVS